MTPSYKKHHPQTANCCLRVGQQPLQLRWFCPQTDDLGPAERWTSGKWSPPLAEEPHGPPCCCHNLGCGCCTGAGEHWHFHHPTGSETGSGLVQLRKGNSIIQNDSFMLQITETVIAGSSQVFWHLNSSHCYNKYCRCSLYFYWITYRWQRQLMQDSQFFVANTWL